MRLLSVRLLGEGLAQMATAAAGAAGGGPAVHRTRHDDPGPACVSLAGSAMTCASSPSVS
jgi:hypothetical protein